MSGWRNTDDGGNERNPGSEEENEPKHAIKVEPLDRNLVQAKIEEAKVFMKNALISGINANNGTTTNLDALVRFYDGVFESMQEKLFDGNIFFEPLKDSVKGLVAGLADAQKAALIGVLGGEIDNLDILVTRAADNVFKGLFVNDQMMQFSLGLKELGKKYRLQDVKGTYKGLQREVINYFYFQKNYSWKQDKLFEAFVKKPVGELIREKKLPPGFEDDLKTVLDQPEFPLVDYSREDIIVINELFGQDQGNGNMVLSLRVLHHGKEKDLMLLDPKKASSQLVVDVATLLEREFGKDFVEVKEMHGYLAVLINLYYMVSIRGLNCLKKSEMTEMRVILNCIIQHGYHVDQPMAWMNGDGAYLFSIKKSPAGLDKTQVLQSMDKKIDQGVLKIMMDKISGFMANIKHDDEELWALFQEMLSRDKNVSYAEVVEEYVFKKIKRNQDNESK